MNIRKLERFLATCERFLFSTETLETLPGLVARGLDIEAAKSVLRGRQLARRIEPFTGFASPPGRF